MCRLVGSCSRIDDAQTDPTGFRADRFLSRKGYNVLSPKAKDSLTPLGRTLIEPLSAICKWAQPHLP